MYVMFGLMAISMMSMGMLTYAVSADVWKVSRSLIDQSLWCWNAIYTSMFMAVWLIRKVGVRRINPWGELLRQEVVIVVVIIHKTLDDLLAMFAFNCVAKPHVICRVMWVRVKQTHKRLCVVGPWDRRHRFLYLAGSILPSSG